MSKVWICENGIPAFAGMTAFNLTPSSHQQRHPRECGDLLQEMPRRDNQIPAFAGMTAFNLTPSTHSNVILANAGISCR